MSYEPLGKLYVVATPIGNLEDFTARAQKTLQKVSWIACEDTRHCKPLLNHYAINTHCLSLHNFNEKKKVERLISELKSGQSGALISDAGTPVISDPGYHLVSLAHEAGVQVIPIPGANAAVSALSALAIQEGPFYFEGFLPPKTNARKERLKALEQFECQLVFYEAPHRIKNLFADLVEVYGEDRIAGVARELTKVYESVCRGSLSELNSRIESGDIPEKGEFVVIVQGCQTPSSWESQHMELIQSLLPYLPINKVAKVTSQLTGMSRKECYDIALMVQDKIKPNQDSN